MKILLSILSNMSILAVSVFLLWVSAIHIEENRSWAYFMILLIMVGPLTAVIVGASNNIINCIKNGPN